ncbi:MAG: hypothetical protein WKF86_10740, partial [Acidimicrobiales bacterium]
GACALSACKASSPASSGKDAARDGLNLLVVTPEAETGKPSRLVFVLQDDEKEFITPKEVTLQFGPAQDRFTSPVVQGRIFTDAAPAPPYFTVEAELAPKGVVWAQATVDGKTATAPITIVDSRRGLVPGQPMPALRTPTPGDAAGVDPVCTRSPACPWHDVSLDEALKQARPLAVLVSTPAFCQTATCGPVLDILLRAAPEVGDRVGFIHLEVYATRPSGPEVTRTPLAPAVKAFALATEPVLFLVAPDGVVKDRIDGLYGTEEATQALKKLL